MKNNQKVCIIGLGYVGFPLAVLCSTKGYEVFGFDKDEEKLRRIEKRENIVEEKYLEEMIPKAKINVIRDESKMNDCDIFIIAVPTPVDEKYYPDLSFVVSASETVAKNMKPGALVIVESTINPGVCDEIVKPVFEKAGFTVGKDVFIAHCPERINPGDPKWNVTNIPRVVGSFDEKGLARALEFYKSIISAEIMPMKSIFEAEATKIMENSFRDINIAFVNELAKSFDLMGINVVNVIRGAVTKPFAFMPHWPSCGVGGHCIPVDPYYLIEKAKELDFDHKFLRVAREINNGMPLYTVELLQDALNKVERSFKGTNIGILGVSYKANVGDLRESPALKIIELLEQREAVLHVFDPHVSEKSTAASSDEVLEKSEAIIVATNHKEFIEIPAEKFRDKGIKVIIDGMNCLDKERIQKLGIVYKGIGR
ncbi:MAG: nucleotide sugar dehydrogenase [Patescibacteria group bacterium]|nr:nucleotide sugar dehydrogenase [Patescibacteria group bacterium]